MDGFNAIKQAMIQPVILHDSLLALNVGVLLRVTLLNKHELNALTDSPSGQQIADVFWRISTPYSLRMAPSSDDLIQRPGDSASR